jgi:hypothetical protein
MTSQERAYIAGIIDGEGTITLSRAHANEMPAPKVSVANNNLPLLNWIKEKVGTGVIITRSKRAPHHGSQYVLDISDNSALKLLAEVKEYLIIKKPHAELLVLQYKAVTPRNGRYTKKLLFKKLQLVARIRALNLHSAAS